MTIPRGEGDLQVETPVAPDFENASLWQAVKLMVVGATKKHHLTVPRDLVAAVQLCPWKVVTVVSRGRESAWAVQGLLVLKSAEDTSFHRLPIMLTCDAVGAARLMQQLAAVLQVPFLFCADAAGWKAELMQAKNRPPLRYSGVVD